VLSPPEAPKSGVDLDRFLRRKHVAGDHVIRRPSTPEE
jgi:hypothetical protein